MTGVFKKIEAFLISTLLSMCVYIYIVNRESFRCFTSPETVPRHEIRRRTNSAKDRMSECPLLRHAAVSTVRLTVNRLFRNHSDETFDLFHQNLISHFHFNFLCVFSSSFFFREKTRILKRDYTENYAPTN